MDKDFRQQFFMILDKLINKENFAFSRFSDGEMYIMQGVEVKLDDKLIQVGSSISNGEFYKKEDFKHFDPTNSEHMIFKRRLMDAYAHRQHNYFKGIGCPCCVDINNFNWFIETHGGDDDSLSYANLFVNGNYLLFMDNFLTFFHSIECVMVCHESATLHRLPFVKKDFRVWYNAMINDYSVIDDIENWIEGNSIQNTVFLFSASSFSNLAIHRLYSKFPNNTYIDIGTTLSRMMGIHARRNYVDAYWDGHNHPEAFKICNWG
jgi:hypothetical protein